MVEVELVVEREGVRVVELVNDGLKGVDVLVVEGFDGEEEVGVDV